MVSIINNLGEKSRWAEAVNASFSCRRIHNYKTCRSWWKKIFKLIKSKTKQKANKANLKSFIFTENGFGENELLFSKGDRFFVAVTHDDAVLIEKENDDNNPYFVSGEWLKEVSDYDGTI